MQAKYELVEKNGCEVKIRAHISSEEFLEAVQKAYNKNKTKFTIQGFRKGKAPKAVIERHYGEGVFYEDAINILLPTHYEAALDELDIKPVAKPDIDVEKIEPKEEFVFVAVITVAPEFDLEGYKGVEVEEYSTEPTDEDVEAEIENNRKQNARIVTKEEAAEEGDTVNIDFVGSVDGVKFDGGAGENHDLKLGSKTFIPGFEDQLIGVKAGDEKIVKVTFPEAYSEPSLAGKDAEFDVKVNGVTMEILPELDDEFAKDVSEFDTLDEYRESIRKELKEKAEKNKEGIVRQRTMDAVTALMDVELPEKMVDAEIDVMLNDFGRQLAYQGLKIEQYAEYVGGMDVLRDQMKEDAAVRIKQSLAIEKVIEKENIEATQEDVDKEMNAFAELRKVKPEEIKYMFEGENLQYVKDNIASKKAVDFLVEHASFVSKK